jgi:phytoene/squalene synthetase
METHGHWQERAAEWVNAGFTYAETLRSRRLRAATVLPAMLARETLERMRGADFETLRKRVKVPRSQVYLALMRALAGRVG